MENVWTIAVVLGSLLNPSVLSLDPGQVQQIQDFFEEYLECTGVPGLSLASVKDGVTELATGFGVANLVSGDPVSGATLFNIASTLKAFNAVLLSKLLSESTEYTWDTPVRDILGESFYLYSGAATNRTMLRDLASHKTGIVRHDYVWILNAVTRDESIKRLRFLKPVVPPRTTFQYTNTLYALMGQVSEHLSGGTSWEDLIEENFFVPLGMSSSTFIYRSLPELTGHATPYVMMGEEVLQTPWQMFIGLEAYNSVGGISTNAEDMAKWMNFLLGHGPPEMDSNYVSQTFIPELVSFNVPFFSRPDDPVTMEAHNYYARAWYAGHYRGYKTYTHPGNFHGYHAYVYILPDLAIGVFHALNLETPKQHREMVSAFVLDVLLGEEPWFTAQDVCNAGHKSHHKSNEESSDFLPTFFTHTMKTLENTKPTNSWKPRSEDYNGEYGNFYYGNVTIKTAEIGEEIFLNLLYGEGNYLLIPTGEKPDNFDSVGNNELSPFVNIGLAEFLRNEQDQVDRLRIADFEFRDDPPIFTRNLKMHDAPPPDLQSC